MGAPADNVLQTVSTLLKREVTYVLMQDQTRDVLSPACSRYISAASFDNGGVPKDLECLPIESSTAAPREQGEAHENREWRAEKCGKGPVVNGESIPQFRDHESHQRRRIQSRHPPKDAPT